MSHQGRVRRCARGALSLATIAILSFGFLAAAPSASAAEVTIAVVRDGPGPEDRLVGLIELVSVFLLRPFTLAVRLFANMVAGHLMLTLLLGSGVIFLTAVGDIGIRALIGIPWFVLGVAIFVFEVVVSVLQAYIFTLLSAVYIQSSIQFEH